MTPLEKVLDQINDLSEEDLLTLNGCVVQNIKALRTRKAQRIKNSLSPGDKVTFTGREKGRGGRTFPVTGTVVRVKRKRAKVVAQGQMWDVNLTVLKKVG